MYEIDKKKFGALVSQLRKEKGYTQKELAEKLFLSDKAISKWETGNSIPDTTMLIPLADLLGVTVTELLMCERIRDGENMDTKKVEIIVKTAITYSDEKIVRAYQVKSRWHLIYICCLFLGVGLTWINYSQHISTTTLLVSMILGAVFGAYFCFCVKMKLPSFYDENRCGLYYDWGFELNLPGAAFNNSNWFQVVRSVRIWACFTMILHPILNFVMSYINREFWMQVESYIVLVVLLGGLFLPIYMVSRKVE